MEAICHEANGVMGLTVHLAQWLQWCCFSLEFAWLDVGGADYGVAIGAVEEAHMNREKFKVVSGMRGDIGV